jgi:hypothetical protein
MAWLVNGVKVPEELVREEFHRLARDPHWNTIANVTERARQLRVAAERCAQDRVLIEQAAAKDERPIDGRAVDAEIERQRAQRGGPVPGDPAMLRRATEWRLRVHRAQSEMVSAAVPPSTGELLAFFEANRAEFRKPEMFEASHIVKYVNREQSEEQAEARITEVEKELERGLPFHEAADRFSDCSDPGGRLPEFPAGYMVEEFEEELRQLQPGERSGIFTTPFGFHIAVLHSMKPAGYAGFEEVRARIEQVLTYARQHEAYQRSIEQLRTTAEIYWLPDQAAK